MEKQKNRINNLIELSKSNPELRIVPKVDSDVVADVGYSYWIGGWGSAEIDHMINGCDVDFLMDDRMYFYSSDDGQDVREEIAEHYNLIPEITDEEINEKVEEEMKKIEWEKVITVDVTLP